jgi:hypothetical protein
MITQQTNYSDIAALHKQNTANQNTVAGNKNISSMLSQIQDEGPAYADSQVDSQRSAKSNESPGYQQNDVLNNEKKQPDLSAQFMRNRNTQAATGLNKNKTTWIQVSLISFVALALTFFLFRLDARTDQLEVSLNSHDDVLDSIDSYTSELSPGFRSIKKTLKAVKQELELIKGSTVSETKVENTVVSEQLQPPSISDNIGIMDDEILALKNELKIAKDKLKAISSDKGRAGNPVVDEKASVASAIATTGWVVNLASFTDINKTEKALEPLYAAGLSPLIQEANVNGQRIYRLIIDGFASHADAKLFVRRADDEFGLHGGWIRKS